MIKVKISKTSACRYLLFMKIQYSPEQLKKKKGKTKQKAEERNQEKSEFHHFGLGNREAFLPPSHF